MLWLWRNRRTGSGEVRRAVSPGLLVLVVRRPWRTLSGRVRVRLSAVRVSLAIRYHYLLLLRRLAEARHAARGEQCYRDEQREE